MEDSLYNTLIEEVVSETASTSASSGEPIDYETVTESATAIEERNKRIEVVLERIEYVLKAGRVPKYAKDSVRAQLMEKYKLYIEYGPNNGG